MFEYALIAALGWLTIDQATELGEMTHANKQLTATITSNNKALKQCYADIKDNEKSEIKYRESIKSITSESRQTLIELESLRNSSPDLRAFDKCRLPDEVWESIAPNSEYGLQSTGS